MFLCLCPSVDPARWWLRGYMPNALANSIITLLQDMTAVSIAMMTLTSVAAHPAPSVIRSAMILLQNLMAVGHQSPSLYTFTKDILRVQGFVVMIGISVNMGHVFLEEHTV